MSAESASLKIRNLSPFHSVFKQTDFLRFVPPIFLTLTSQGGNQGMLTSCRELKVRQRRCVKKRNPSSRDSVINIATINLHPLFPLSRYLVRHLQLNQYLCAEIGIGMKQIFLIDYENVGLAGLTGISKLGSDDELVIFYSGDISVVKELLSAYKDRGVKISYECLSYAGKNALDFMVSVRAGYECRARSKKEIHIVSKDNGYKSALVYATKLNKNVVVDSYVNIANKKLEPAKIDWQSVLPESKEARREKYQKLLSATDVPKKYHEQLVSALMSSRTIESFKTKVWKALGKKNLEYVDAVLKCYGCVE